MLKSSLIFIASLHLHVLRSWSYSSALKHSIILRSSFHRCRSQIYTIYFSNARSISRESLSYTKSFEYNSSSLYSFENHYRSYIFKYKKHNLAVNRIHYLLQIVTTNVNLSLIYIILIIRIKSVQFFQWFSVNTFILSQHS